MLPPRLVRRLVLAPMVMVIALGVIVLSPLLGLLALLFGLAGLSRAGRMRNLRLLSFAVVWLTAEIVALFILLGLWIISGFGGRMRTEPYQSRHYAVIRRFLDALYRGAERTYGLRVEVEEPELTGQERAARLARPVIVLSRHAGPGDSFLLVHQLLSVYGRRPRVVMKAALQFDPSLDVVGNRLPNVFIHHRKTGDSIFTEQIERLARGLDQTGALVIFPEGANWTPARWHRGIRRLEHAGRRDLAARARDMPNLLPPRPGGTLAAIAACPEADVIFVAHAGLDTILTVGDIWRRFPVDQVLRARWWRVPSDQVPRAADHEAQLQWLYEWWERIDTWITEHRPGGAVPAAVPLADGGPAEPVGELSGVLPAGTTVSRAGWTLAALLAGLIGAHVPVLHLLFGDAELDSAPEPGHVAGGDLHFLAAPQVLLEQHAGDFAGVPVDAERAEFPDVAVGGVDAVAAVLLLLILGRAESFGDEIYFFDHVYLPEVPAVHDLIAVVGRSPAFPRGEQLYFAVAGHQLGHGLLGGGQVPEFLLGLPEPDAALHRAGNLAQRDKPGQPLPVLRFHHEMGCLPAPRVDDHGLHLAADLGRIGTANAAPQHERYLFHRHLPRFYGL